jgi:EAL domain-containing protein (putative c-di-GMP-specific phosphodiesterase class I)
MAESLAINSIVQARLKTWLESQSLSWTPRVLTGFRRMSAGETLSVMENAGEVDTVIIECAQAQPEWPRSQHFHVSVNIRVRHDSDRVSEDDHSSRVNEIIALIQDFDTFTASLNALEDFSATQVQIDGQAQTSSGRSYETTVLISMVATGRTIT